VSVMEPMADRLSLSGQAADLVAALRRAMRKAARAGQPAMPLSVAQLELLSLVEENPGARPGDLADLLRLAPNSVSTLANAMVGTGMLARAPGTRDRRTVEYTLTAEGLAMVSQWRRTNSLLLARAVAELSQGEQKTLASALPVLAHLIEAINARTEAVAHVEEGPTTV